LIRIYGVKKLMMGFNALYSAQATLEVTGLLHLSIAGFRDYM